MLVTTTVLEEQQLPLATAALANLAPTARINLRPVWGSQDSAFVAPHDVCVDSRGDLYVAEVTKTFGWPRGVPESAHSFQKFARAG